MKKIKTKHREKWIDYEDKVLIIKRHSRGNVGRFQYDGTSCLQGRVQGFMASSFTTTSKWFNEAWWYKKTAWSRDDSKVYFHKKGEINVDDGFDFEKKFSQEKFDAHWNKVYKKATKLALPVDMILKTMFREINKKTKMNLQPDFYDLHYGKSWYEAYLPVKDENGNKFLITWHNCD